jgi:hypothetical protein
MEIRKAGGAFAALMLIAAVAPGAWAQDFHGISLEESRSDLFQPQEQQELMMGSVSIQGRYSVPLGTLTISQEGNNEYVDAFNAGLGVQGEGSLLFPLGPKWHLGPYLLLGFDRYEGSTAREMGQTLRPDRLDLTSFLVGPRALLQMGRHTQLDFHMAFGAAHYSKVDAVYTPSGGLPQEGVLLKAATKFAFDLGIRFNVNTGPVFFDVGFDFRTQGAPGQGDLPVNPGALFSFGLEFGAGVAF